MANPKPKPGPGRPKGSLNKITKEIKEIAREYGPMAIGELARLARAADSESARVAAIKELLDRGYGKSPQPMTGEGGEGPMQLIVGTGVPRAAGD